LLEQCMSNLAIVNQVLEEFQTQAVGDLEQLQKSVGAGDSQQTARVAHALKGAAGILSAEALRQVASELEQLGRACDLAPATACMERLHLEVTRCLQHIPKVQAELSDKALKQHL